MSGRERSAAERTAGARGPGERESGKRDPSRDLPVVGDPSASALVPGDASPGAHVLASRSDDAHPFGDAVRRPIDRRRLIQMMAAAAVAPALGSCEREAESAAEAGASGVARAPSPSSNPLARGTLWDPDLIAPVLPWEKILTEDERAGLAALCDVIIPADPRSPAASAVGAHDFIDEYVSAPFRSFEDDRVLVRGGLVWLDGEAARRFGNGKRFRALTAAQQSAICDDICHADDAAPQFAFGARFFDKVRDLAATAFYTTPEGMDDVGYVGNAPLAGPWPPPPPEALRHLGLEGTTT